MAEPTAASRRARALVDMGAVQRNCMRLSGLLGDSAGCARS